MRVLTSGTTTATVNDCTVSYTDVNAILTDTNELQTDDYPARFTGIEGATFNTATDSLEVIRNDRTLAAADYVVVGDTIAGVTLCTTTTTNTDMVGTDGAATAIEMAKVPKSDSNVTFNATTLASINAECDTALTDIKLDHLLAVADADDVVDDSVIAKLASKGATADWSSYVNTTDSQEAIRDNQAGSDVNAIADAVWNEATSGHTTAGTFGEQCKTDIDAILEDTANTIPGTIATVDGNVDTLITNQLPDETLSATGGTLTTYAKGTTNVISTKNLFDPANAAVNSTEDIIAKSVEQ